MPWEDIGDCGDGQIPHERDWLILQLELGIKYLLHACGNPPPGFELGIMWHEHEYGEYPTIGLFWDDAMRGVPWDYIHRCEVALAAFDQAVGWSEIHPDLVREKFKQ